MNKAQEIAHLTQFIAALPKDSYLKPWFESVLPEVSRDIRNDIFPSATVDVVRKECESRVAEAKASAESIIKHATDAAARITAEANRDATNTILHLRRAIQNSLNSLPHA